MTTLKVNVATLTASSIDTALSDYQIGDLLSLNEKDFHHAKFKNLEDWVKHRLVALSQTSQTSR